MSSMRMSRQWMSRPDDERFTSLHALAAYTSFVRDNSRELVIANRDIRFIPDEEDNEHKGLYLQSAKGSRVSISHHAFSQACGKVKAPAAYLQDLPSPLVADCLNFGLHVKRNVEDLGLLIGRHVTPAGVVEGAPNRCTAITGPTYGRVWDAEVSSALVEHMGDGVTGKWRVPGPFNGRLNQVTKENTSIFAGEQDMFVFLSDDENRIEMKDRRDGKSGQLSRGIYAWNSQVGAGTLGVAFFLYDYMCSNRIIWGMSEYQEVRVRHTKGAPNRWMEEVMPTIEAYSKSSQQPILEVIESARQKVMGDKMESFLATRFGGRADAIGAAFLADEGRPMETLWDVITGATALARAIPVQSNRVALEREAGRLLAMAA